MRDENKLLTFERKVLKKIYGHIKKATKVDYERRNNVDLEQIYN